MAIPTDSDTESRAKKSRAWSLIALGSGVSSAFFSHAAQSKRSLLVVGALLAVQCGFAVVRSRRARTGPLAIPALSYLALATLSASLGVHLLALNVELGLERSMRGLFNSIFGGKPPPPSTAESLLDLGTFVLAVVTCLCICASIVAFSRVRKRPE